MSATKIVLITGSNSGVGYEAIKVFLEADKPYHILAAARTPEKAESAVASAKKECPDARNTIEPLVLDVTIDESIQKAFEQVEAHHGRVDALINNAGATFDMEFLDKKVSLRESFNRAYDVNVTGANVTTWIFIPLLLKSADPRLLFIAGLSQMTQVYDGPYFPTPPQPAGWPKKIDFETIGYRCSKTALNMLMLDWNHKLKADGVKVWAVSPGFVVTNLGNRREMIEKMGGGDAREGAEIYKKVVEGERDDQVGKVIDKHGLLPL